MVRHLLRPLWVLLALLFFVEAWLWDHLQPVVSRVVALIPVARLNRGAAAVGDAVRLCCTASGDGAAQILGILFSCQAPVVRGGRRDLFLQARRCWYHGVHLRCDARQAYADALVLPRLRCRDAGTRVGARADRADPPPDQAARLGHAAATCGHVSAPAHEVAPARLSSLGLSVKKCERVAPTTRARRIRGQPYRPVPKASRAPRS